MSFMRELRDIYAEKPDWLRLKDMDISRHDDHCVVHDPDDGSFVFIKTVNLFLHKDGESISPGY